MTVTRLASSTYLPHRALSLCNMYVCIQDMDVYNICTLLVVNVRPVVTCNSNMVVCAGSLLTLKMREVYDELSVFIKPRTCHHRTDHLIKLLQLRESFIS